MRTEYLMWRLSHRPCILYGKATMIEFNTSEGEIGVYKNHIPLTTVLVPGVVTITSDEGLKTAAVHAGFAEILSDRVTILAEIAEWPMRSMKNAEAALYTRQRTSCRKASRQ